jgi:hypothetical protein
MKVDAVVERAEGVLFILDGGGVCGCGVSNCSRRSGAYLKGFGGGGGVYVGSETEEGGWLRDGLAMLGCGWWGIIYCEVGIRFRGAIERGTRELGRCDEVQAQVSESGYVIVADMLRR